MLTFQRVGLGMSCPWCGAIASRAAREWRVEDLVRCSAEAGRALVDFLYTDKLGWRLAGTVF